MNPTDHAGMTVLSYEECVERLGLDSVGRVAFLADGDVQVFPVNYRWHDGAVVFRTAEGTKLSAAEFHKPVAFEIDGWNAEHQAGWSVVAKGLAKEVTDEDMIAELDSLGLRPWAGEEKNHWVRIRPDEITGRKID